MELNEKYLETVSGGKTIPATDLKEIPAYEAAERLKKGDPVVYIEQGGLYMMNNEKMLGLKAGYYLAVAD